MVAFTTERENPNKIGFNLISINLKIYITAMHTSTNERATHWPKATAQGRRSARCNGHRRRPPHLVNYIIGRVKRRALYRKEETDLIIQECWELSKLVVCAINKECNCQKHTQEQGRDAFTTSDTHT